MTFFRVENKKKEGPYRNNQPVTIMEYLEKNHHIEDSCDGSYMEAHPTPYDDPLLWGSELSNIKGNGSKAKYIFGFESLDKLFNWFSMKGEIEYLKEYKFKVSVYETDDCFHGEWQSIAHKESLKLVDTLEF